MITIAVDAMGGDNAPRPEVEGSVLAAREFGVRILLVGQPNAVRPELAKHAAPNLPIEIVPASEVITMNDHPAQAFRRKKDSSVHVAARRWPRRFQTPRAAFRSCSMSAPTWIPSPSISCSSPLWEKFITVQPSAIAVRASGCFPLARKRLRATN